MQTLTPVMPVAVLAALPQEYTPLKRLLPSCRSGPSKPLRCFHGSFPDKTILLAETGMGQASIVEAMAWVCEHHSPELILSIGFAGSLHPSFAVGQVVLGTSLVFADAAFPQALREPLIVQPSPQLIEFCEHQGLMSAQVVTTLRVKSKAWLRLSFPDPPSVVDMETCLAAHGARERGIPFLSFRAISDGVHDTIDFDPGALADSKGHVRLSKVLASIGRDPRLLKSFYRLRQNSDRASKNLARALSAFLNLPVPQLRQMIVGPEQQAKGFVEG